MCPAARIFRGVRAMQESDTYLAILEEGEKKGQAKAKREDILLFGEGKFGPPDESVEAKLSGVMDLSQLKRMVRCAVNAKNWQEILDTP
jgi:hypothetical protein